MLNSFTLALLAAVVGVANAGCNRDNCLRAVIASAFPTRSGAADCSSYFLTTVIPATVTYTSTLSQTSSTTTRGTALVVTTSTEIQPVTITKQTTTTTVETDFATVVINAKRQRTDSPSQIPAYASACSGAVRYSSACSCVGVTPSTVIAVAPSTTVTVTVVGTETSTYSTTTTSTVVETDFSTTIDTETITLLSTTTSTTTTTHVRPPYQTCSGPPFNVAGGGGCSSQCYCDISVGSLQLGFCNAAPLCGRACSTDNDCPDFSACTSGHSECNGGNVCLDFSLCLSVNAPKMRAMRGRAENKRDGTLIRTTNTGGSNET